MKRVLLVGALLLASAAPAAAQGQQPEARVTQVDTAAYPDITLYVSVTDAEGAPVGGLAASDFRITEDGQPVTIGNFAGGGEPFTAVLAIDRSGSMDQAGKMDGAKEAALAFVEQMRQGDMVGVVAFDDTPRLLASPTRSVATLRSSIGDLEAEGSTALYDSIVVGVQQLASASGRRSLILLTDGRDQRFQGDPTPISEHTLAQAIQVAQQAGVAIQVIGLGDRSSDDDVTGIDEGVLQQIASATGGQYIYAPSAGELAALYRSLAASMQAEYRITYRSPRPTFDGTRRDIRVQAAGSGAAGGSYLEQHLIHVRSSPALALLLLLPILGLLVAPRLVRGRVRRAPQPAPAAPQLAPPDAPRFCDQCGKPLRPGVKFCAGCGSRVPTEALR